MHIVVRKVTVKDIILLALMARVTFREAFGHLFHDNETLISFFAKSFSIEALTKK